MSEQNIFEQASQKAVRFPSSRGMLDTEELWNLPMKELDEVGMSFQRQINDAGDVESLIAKKASVNPLVKLGLEICKRIIEVRQEAEKNAEDEVLKKQRLQKLLELRDKKVNDKEAEMPLDEIDAMILELRG